MPAWLISIILELVLNFGIPRLVEWLKKRFGIGASNQVVQVLSDYVEDAKKDKAWAKRRAKDRLKECTGVGCPTDLKR